METIKCLTVGDGTVGKTCMLIAYTTNKYAHEYIPTVLDHYTAIVMVNNKPMRLELWDTAGQEDYQYLRPLAYSHSDVFLICFSIADPTTYKNVKDAWKPEVSHFCPRAIIILVGTKLDLREDNRIIEHLKMRGESPISRQQGLQLAKSIGAYKYVECSAISRVGVKEVFDSVLTSVLMRESRKTSRRRCTLL